jgi:hypothetical protein
MLQAHAAGIVFSIDKVLAEVNQGRKTCPLRQWVATKVPKGFWLRDSRDKAVMQEYPHVIGWAHGLGQFNLKALSDFSSDQKADAFLIAVGRAKGHIIVTHEGESTDSVGRVMIPHAAHSCGVRTLSLYDLLEKHATNTFAFKP